MRQVAELMPHAPAKPLAAAPWRNAWTEEPDWSGDKVQLQVLFRPQKVTGEHSSVENTSSYNYPTELRFGHLTGTILRR